MNRKEDGVFVSAVDNVVVCGDLFWAKVVGCPSKGVVVGFLSAYGFDDVVSLCLIEAVLQQ